MDNFLICPYARQNPKQFLLALSQVEKSNFVTVMKVDVMTHDPLPVTIACNNNVYLVQGFRSKNLEAEESKCVTECAQKYMKMTQRVGLRMGEYQYAKSQLQQRK